MTVCDAPEGPVAPLRCGGVMVDEPGPESNGSDVKESWVVGVAAAGDHVASLRVHAGYVAAGPASGRPFRVHVRFRLKNVTDSGFPGVDEVAALQVAEERVIEALDESAVLVGVVGAPGFRDLVIHAADPDAVRRALDTCVLVDLGYEPELDEDEDPAWSSYRALFAQAVDGDFDRRVIARLANAGADLAAEHPVRHYVAFSELDDAYGFIAALRAADIDARLDDSDDPGGLAGSSLGASLRDARDNGRVVVMVSEDAVVSQVTAALSRAGLAELAASWGGLYSGWTVEPAA